ncbi:hypothetical protein O3S80_30010 [Streptomyces sp. Lzd4kr]|nr:hypothetical protein [Streptomyces sp. Lzd4kr]
MTKNRPVPDVAVVSAVEDAVAERALRDFLKAAGVPLVDDSADVLVVLISEHAVDDPEWQARVEHHRGARLVPVRIDGVRSSRAPAHLRPLNWVALDPASPVTALGTMLAAILSDPEHVRQLRNLRAEAEAWLRTDRSVHSLINDHGRASEAHRLLATLKEDNYIDTGGVVSEFVEGSYRHTRKARALQRWRRGAGTVVVVVMAFIVALTVPRILRVKGTDFNALVTYGDPASAREMPEWSSLQSASLLVRGNAQQQAQARQTLASLLSVPWSLNGPVVALDQDDHGAVDGLALLPDDQHAAVLARSEPGGTHSLGLYDIRKGEVLWQVRLGKGYADISASADGRTVLAVGKKGTAVIDLGTRKIRRLDHVEGGFAELHVTKDGQAVVGRAHRLVVGSLDKGDFRTVGDRYETLLSLEATSDGGARALVTASPGHYRLLDALTGKVLADAKAKAPLIHAGAVAPDRVQAVFAGADRQLWELRPGRPPAPTGIAVPERTTTMALLDEGRVVVGGQDQRARVLRLADGSELGVVCRDVPRLERLLPSPFGDLIGCWGPFNLTLWRGPAGPRGIGATDSLHTETTSAVSAATATVSVRGDGGAVVVEPSWRSAFRMRLFATDVVATAVSKDGSQLVAAADSGDIAVVSLRMSDDQPRVMARWRIPGGGPARAVGWSGETPLVRGPGSEVWEAPGCPGCTTDEGLIARLKERLYGCWTQRQLHEVDDDTRHVLGVTECRPLPEPVEG